MNFVDLTPNLVLGQHSKKCAPKLNESLNLMKLISIIDKLSLPFVFLGLTCAIIYTEILWHIKNLRKNNGNKN